MFRVAIVEDDEKDYGMINSFFTAYAHDNGDDGMFRIVRYKSALTFLDGYNGNFDIVFFDIMLPDIDGLEAARRLRAVDSNVMLIFVTNMAHLAVNGYEVNAFDYIVKPVSYSNFALKLKRALSSVNRRDGILLRLRIDGGFATVNTNDIAYIETSGHNLVYHAKSGDYSVRGTLKSVQETLPQNFKRCNSCYIVNLNYVTKLQDVFVYLRNTRLQISQHKRAEFVHALNNFLNNDTGD